MTEKPIRSITVREPWKIEVEYTFGGFNLTFQGSGENGERRKAVIVLHFCDVGTIAGRLWDVIKQRQRAITNITEAMRGKE